MDIFLWTAIITQGTDNGSQFSIIRLERDTQLTIPAYDYLVPDKECPGNNDDDDPCALFGRIPFPSEEFFPPDVVEDRENYRSLL